MLEESRWWVPPVCRRVPVGQPLNVALPPSLPLFFRLWCQGADSRRSKAKSVRVDQGVAAPPDSSFFRL